MKSDWTLRRVVQNLAINMYINKCNQSDLPVRCIIIFTDELGFMNPSSVLTKSYNEPYTLLDFLD